MVAKNACHLGVTFVANTAPGQPRAGADAQPPQDHQPHPCTLGLWGINTWREIDVTGKQGVDFRGSYKERKIHLHFLVHGKECKGR